jgi:hypothetical protein
MREPPVDASLFNLRGLPAEVGQVVSSVVARFTALEADLAASRADVAELQAEVRRLTEERAGLLDERLSLRGEASEAWRVAQQLDRWLSFTEHDFPLDELRQAHPRLLRKDR